MKEELLLKYLLEDFVKKHEPITKTLEIKINLTDFVFVVEHCLN